MKLLFESLFFTFYRFVFWPFLLAIVFVASLFNGKIRNGLKERMRPVRWPTFTRAPIWIHASSGEFEYAKSVIRKIKESDPHIPVVVTYFSPTYAQAIRHFPGVTFSTPLPLDLPGPTREFLRQLKPCALLIARTDLWPELLRQVRQQKIPSLLFATTFRPVTGPRALLRPFLRLVYSQLTQIYAVAEADKSNLQKLCIPTPISVQGDTRYDQVLYRLSHPKSVVTIKNSYLPTLVAGSTWAQDEKPLLLGLKDFLVQKQMQLILVPHEPTPAHLSALKQQLDRLGIPWTCYSQYQQDKNTVVIVDQVGLLAELYMQGQMAFVGGSFKSKVHSVMEPIAAGLPVIVGPHYANNRESVELSQTAIGDNMRAVTCCPNSTAIREHVRHLLQHQSELRTGQGQLKNIVANRSGRSQVIYDWLKLYSDPGQRQNNAN